MTRSVKEKVTVSVDPSLLEWADALVTQGSYDSRSAAMEAALEALYQHREEQAYERALALLNPVEEKALAEEGMADYARLVLGSERPGAPA
jgi:Arc/MetJ-type ribon-helix-helix transcriptional regulator